MSWLSRILSGKARKSDLVWLLVISLVWLLVLRPSWWLAALIIAFEVCCLVSLVAYWRKER